MVLGGCESPKKDSAVPESAYNLKTSDIVVRDPFVFADVESKKYYIHGNKKITKPNPTKSEVLNKDANAGIYCYESKDLKNWRYVGESFKSPKEFWGKRDFWAPDMFKLNGKYYIIATFSSDEKIPSSNGAFDKLRFRGCAALVSDKPEGPYKPVSMTEPLTPKKWMCLDGTLWEEDGKLWLIYCHEWVQTIDGEIVAQEVSRDLKRTIGKPIVLFKASEAPWQQPMSNGARVTDAGVINRAKDGTLFMTWSSHTKDKSGKMKYAIGLAVSENGKLFGKWKHLKKPINDDDGGHAMLFKTFDGKDMISYHAPNTFPERTVIRPFEFSGGKVVLGDDICEDVSIKRTEANAKK